MPYPEKNWNVVFEGDLRDYLVRFLRTRLARGQDAEDLSQEVYLRLLRSNNYKEVRNHRAYALQVAAHVAFEWNQLARNRMPHSSSDLTALVDSTEPSRNAEVKQQLDALGEALATLTPKCRAVLLMHRRDGLTYKEISCQLGLSVSMVRKYIAQGLAKCQKALL